MTLLAECAAPAPALGRGDRRDAAVGDQARGEVKLVAAGTLPNDGKVIADERPAG